MHIRGQERGWLLNYFVCNRTCQVVWITKGGGDSSSPLVSGRVRCFEEGGRYLILNIYIYFTYRNACLQRPPPPNPWAGLCLELLKLSYIFLWRKKKVIKPFSFRCGDFGVHLHLCPCLNLVEHRAQWTLFLLKNILCPHLPFICVNCSPVSKLRDWISGSLQILSACSFTCVALSYFFPRLRRSLLVFLQKEGQPNSLRPGIKDFDLRLQIWENT